MSHNQPRFEKSEAQFRKPGRSGGGSGHPRGFPSGGGKGGGGGGYAPPASPSLNTSSSGPTQSNPPLPSANRSYRKPGNGQGGQSRVNLTRRNSEVGPVDSASSDHSLPNGVHFHPPSHVASDTSTPSSSRQSDVSTPRSSAPIPRPPLSQSHAGVPISSTPKTPAKGDAPSSFTLQFGSISPGFVNGMQIPARTSSAPPNLDEQKYDQARHDAFRAVPTVPPSSLPKQPMLQQQLPQPQQQPPPQLPQPQQQLPQQQQHRKDIVNRNQPKTVADHPPQQTKRDSHMQNPVLSVPALQKSSNISISGMSMPMFPAAQVPVQFGGHAVQIQPQNVAASPFPMPMVSLSVGNPQQIQQQLFVPTLQSHVMQPQGIMHQGQSLNFTPQISHQLPPQVSSMGMGISTQYSQQQAANFGIQRKTTVKITHPDTHEELRLDKRMDACIDPAGQRSNISLPSQSQPVPSFASPQQINYYQNLQPGSYAPSTYHHTSSLPATNAQMTSASQVPKFNYSSGQSSQTVSITNPYSVNTLVSNKAGSSRHGISESESTGHVHEHLPIPVSAAISAAISASVKPSINIAADKEAKSSMTTNVLRTLGEESGVVKPPVEATCLPEQKVHSNDSSAIKLITTKQEDCELRDTNAVSTTDNPSTANFSVVSMQKARTDMSFYPAAANSVSVAYTSNNKKRNFTTKSEPSKECQQKTREEELRHSQLYDQADVRESNRSSSTVSLNESKEVASADMSCGKVSRDFNNTKPNSVATEIPTSLLPTSSSDTRSCSSSEAGESNLKSEYLCASDPSAVSNQNEASEATNIGFSGASPLTTDGTIARKPAFTEIISSSLSTNTIKFENLEANSAEKNVSDSLEVESRQESPILEARNLGEFDYTSADSYDARTHPAFSTDSMDIADQKMASKEEMTPLYLRANGIVSESGMIASTSTDRTYIDDNSSTNILADKNNNANNIEEIHSQEVSISDLSRELMVKGHTPTLNTLNTTQTYDSTDVAGSISVSTCPSISSSCCKDKPSTGVTQNKNTAGKKKKMKEILSKADAVGTNTDLYMAYKGPQEKNDNTNPENTDSSLISIEKMTAEDAENGVAAHEDGQNRVEVDDWEDAADISTPKLRMADNLEKVNGAKLRNDDPTAETFAKKYSRDFLLTLSDQYTDLPSGFEIGSDIADTLMNAQVGVSHVVDRRQFPSSARIIDRPSAVNRVDRRAVGGLDDDKWTKTTSSFPSNRDFPMDTSSAANTGFRSGQGISHGVLRNPRGAPSQYAGGILSGPMQSSAAHGGTQRGNSDDRWPRGTAFQRGIMPSPQTPSQTMHKAEKRYEVGKVSDEEELKQRQLKAILNKLTPQNFERLFEQVKEVNIDNTITLKGVISQIFDKALTEPTFCEMYADFCLHLSAALPDFSEDNEKITFKRLLLNKCQEEFERGEREEAEADKDEEEGEMKKTKEEREEKKLKARRRMLGNIRLIGELFKKKMLTERIMHECIKTLLGLGQHKNTDEEDIEALCKLMSTIGKMIDHIKAKEHMDAYFDIITKLSNDQKLSSRLRFMLKDIIDLRKNNWQQRRKVEGPKKIEVHRDAVQERQAQTSRLSRGPVVTSSTRRAPVDYGPRSSTLLPNSNSHQLGAPRSFTHQSRGHGAQDVRLDERHHSDGRLLSVPLPQRPLNDDTITLGPQGGLARGMSMRTQPLMPTPSTDITTSTSEPRRVVLGPNGNSSITERPLPRQTADRSLITPDQSQSQDRNPYSGHMDLRSDRSFDRISSNIAASQSQSANSAANLLSEECLQEKSISAIREYYSAKDEKEIALCIKELNAPHFYPAMVLLWVTDSFERKNEERDHLSALLIKLCRSRDSLLSRVQLNQGFVSVLSTLEDAVNDAPKATEFFGRLLARVVIENVLTLREIGKLIHEGGEEPGRLLEIGLAADILGSILEVIKLEKGDAYLNEIRSTSNMQLENFRPPQPLKSRKLEAFL